MCGGGGVVTAAAGENFMGEMRLEEEKGGERVNEVTMTATGADFRF